MKHFAILSAVFLAAGCMAELPTTERLDGAEAETVLASRTRSFSAGSQLDLSPNGTYVFTHGGTVDQGTYEVMPEGSVHLSHTSGPRAGKTDAFVVEDTAGGEYPYRIVYVAPDDMAGKSYGFR